MGVDAGPISGSMEPTDLLHPQHSQNITVGRGVIKANQGSLRGKI